MIVRGYPAMPIDYIHHKIIDCRLLSLHMDYNIGSFYI
jgi:hypothetical protein